MDEKLSAASEMAIDRHLPHKGRMKLVDSLIEFQRETRTGVVLVRLMANAPYFNGGVFQSHWLIELMAQAGAVVSQVLRVGDQVAEAPIGFLIAIRSFKRLDQRPLVPGTVLHIRSYFDVDLDPVGCCISHVLMEDHSIIAESEMTFLSNGAGAD